MYEWIAITQPSDFEKLVDVLDGQADAAHEFDSARLAYGLEGVVENLSANIAPVVTGVLVESPYVDKDYRSTYYNFYVKQGRRFRPDCVRLHFFGKGVSFEPDSLALVGLDPARQPGNQGTPQTYFGFVTLRPTYRNTIGGSMLSPDACLHARGSVMVAKRKVQLLGYELTASGFPWMQQHADISVCAHTVCWSILRYYSARSKKYREHLTYDINGLAYEFDRGGIVPSRGLESVHVERVFAGAGAFPIVVSINPYATPESDGARFFRQLLAYVESGFPVFVGMKGEHAIAVIGVEWSTPGPRDTEERTAHGRFAWDMVKSLITADDNQFPYARIARTPSVSDPELRTVADFEVLIAPLANKINYPAETVDEFSIDLPRQLGVVFDFPVAENRLTRYFATTGSSLRRHMRAHSQEFEPQMLTALMGLPLAQFIWVIEYASSEQWESSEVTVCAIVDATAGRHDSTPLWAIYDGRSALIFDRTQGAATLLPYNPRGSYSRIQPNLSSPLATA